MNSAFLHAMVPSPKLRRFYALSFFETSCSDGYLSVVFAPCDISPLPIAIGIKTYRVSILLNGFLHEFR